MNKIILMRSFLYLEECIHLPFCQKWDPLTHKKTRKTLLFVHFTKVNYYNEWLRALLHTTMRCCFCFSFRVLHIHYYCKDSFCAFPSSHTDRQPLEEFRNAKSFSWHIVFHILPFAISLVREIASHVGLSAQFRSFTFTAFSWRLEKYEHALSFSRNLLECKVTVPREKTALVFQVEFLSSNCLEIFNTECMGQFASTIVTFSLSSTPCALY